MRIFRKGEESEEVLTELEELRETVHHAKMPEAVE